MSRYPVLIRRAFVLPLLGSLRRCAGVVGAVFVCGMALVVVGPQAAYATGTVPVPVSGPVIAEGAATATGTAVTGGQVVGIVAAGLGAYDATCKALEFLSGGWSDCGTSATEFVANKTGFGFVFGSKGDDRSTTTKLSGPAVTAVGIAGVVQGTLAVSGYVGAGQPFNVLVGTGNQAVGGHDTKITLNYGPSSNPCNATVNTWSHYGFQVTLGRGRSADLAALNAAALANPYGGGPGGTLSGTGCSTLSAGIPPRRIVLGASCSGCAGVEAEWLGDQFVGTSWTLDYTLSCEKAGLVVQAVRSVTFTPSAGVTSPLPELPTCESVLPGSHVKSVDVAGGRDTVENPTDVTVHNPSYNNGIAATYPLCTTHAPAGGCFLDLQRDGKSCFGPNVYCAGWPQNLTRWKISCEWGPYLLEVEMCRERYETVFDVLAPPNPKPTIPPEPPAPPEPPCFVGCVAPPVPPVPPDDPDHPEENENNCVSDAFSLNPIDWVYVPVKCVLKWAFVPSSGAFSDAIGALKDDWMGSTPGVWVTAIGDLVPGGSLSGCQGPAFNIDYQSVHVASHPFSACSGGGATAATFVRLVLSIGCIVAGGFGCLRAIGSGFGWRPGSAGADA